MATLAKKLKSLCILIPSRPGTWVRFVFGHAGVASVSEITALNRKRWLFAAQGYPWLAGEVFLGSRCQAASSLVKDTDLVRCMFEKQNKEDCMS